ncbi:hypothetical protein [Bradyrhizobium sp. S3.2.12]|uniref:hypothetical protein n=1 Tax=Bradyrhizobium sp. S3.2.12 TaxID=3156387 RepID=UPI003392A48E
MIILADWPRGAAVTADTGAMSPAQAPFSSSGECVSIENLIGLHGAWKALKLFFFFYASSRWSTAPRQRYNRTLRDGALFMPE